MSQELNLNFLKGLEQEIVLDVLYRDQMLRKMEEERIRKLKMQLQELQWKGSKSTSQEYSEKLCARCQKSLGVLMNRGAVCNGCSHRVCPGCRIILNPYTWKCTVCYAQEDIKAKAGEWFFEERVKKFPAEGKHETAGTKLLESYQKLSNISVIPPTPPPFSESTSGVNTVEHDQRKGFHRSVENLFLSFTTHIKNISKSQNDMTVDKYLLTADYGQEMELRKERRSQSDTAIDIATRVKLAPSLQRLISGAQDGNGIAPERNCLQKVVSSSPLSSIFSAGIKRGSLYSLNSTCSEAGNFEEADVSGEIEFAIRYNFKSSMLEIFIKACKNLAYGEERKKKCNPYIKTYLLPDKSPQSKRKTSIKKNTVDPTFHETLKYKIEYSQLEMRQLQVSAWHSGTFRHRVFLGEVVISFESWNFEDKSTQLLSWYQLKAKAEQSEDNMINYSGELLVRAKLISPSLCNNSEYEDQMKENRKHSTEDKTYPGYQLHLIVLEAKNLPAIRPDGLLNSFVKSCLCILGRRDMKQRTPVLKKQAHPHWKHLFVFSGVTTSQLQQSCLDLTVWDQSTFGLRNQFLGGARLGTKVPTRTSDATSQADLQWQKVLSSPNSWTDITLTLHSNAHVFNF
ncbi:synaptotagmin-like protein 3 isoform X2 [Eublepharis macularius]|uniref:Synaptotagmin-like protein 3 isoform X2 n=1 Tax=Eublepharis macularius TaxID=481883 RepID=A0AA97L2R7_EUBMA|nr:synaptotagmin-like protein 3 isoform X2 [Eublepharis macularius]